MLHDADTWRSASVLIATYGPDAAAVAAGKASRAESDKSRGDARRWRRVAAQSSPAVRRAQSWIGTLSKGPVTGVK